MVWKKGVQLKMEIKSIRGGIISFVASHIENGEF